MSYGPYPMYDDAGVFYALRQGFLEEIRKTDFPGLALAAGHELTFGRWFNEEVRTREIGGLKNVVLSMDVPPIKADGGETKKRSVESPLWTKDLEWGGRRAAAMRAQGLDTAAIRARALAVVEEYNRFILLGAAKAVFNGANDIKGILNYSGIATTAGGSWLDPDVMNDDLGSAYEALAANRQGGAVTLLMPRGDAGVLNRFLPDSGGRRIGEALPGFIRRILFEDDTDIVPAGTAYLINDARRDNFDIIAPQNEDGLTFGLGATNVVDADAPDVGGVSLERIDNIMRARTIRWMNCWTISINRDDASIGGSKVWTQKVTFTT